MKEGDIIEWRGVNKTIRGKVIKDEKGDFVCQLDNGCIFPLKDLRTQDLQEGTYGTIYRNRHRNTHRSCSVG